MKNVVKFIRLIKLKNQKNKNNYKNKKNKYKYEIILVKNRKIITRKFGKKISLKNIKTKTKVLRIKLKIGRLFIKNPLIRDRKQWRMRKRLKAGNLEK